MDPSPVPTAIRPSAFFVADHAEAVAGKLYVTGGCWDTLYVNDLPATHPHLSVAIVMQVPYPETDREHTVEVRLVDEDGNPHVQPMQGRFRANRSPQMQPGDETTVVLVVNFVNLPLRALGPHRFEALVDGRELAQTRVKVVRRDAGPAQTSG